MMFPWQQFAHDAQHADCLALQVLQGEVFTWRQLGQKIDHLAHLLQQQGAQPQDIIGICGKNSLDFLLLYLSVIQLGARVLTLNPQFPTEKIAELCQFNQVQFFFTADQDLCHVLRAKMGKKRGEFFKNFLDLQSDAAHAKFSEKQTALTVDFTLPATFTLTSGSSGLPKSVVHNVQAHLDNAEGVCELMTFTQHDSWLLSLPLYHVSGQGIVWRWLHQGARLLLPSDDFYADIGRASHVSLVPTQLQRWLAYLQQSNSAFSTRHILLGGTQIPVLLTEQLIQLGVQSYSGYGMTEMASTICAKKSDGKIGVGRPLKGRECQIVNNEIWLRGAGLAMGIWREGKLYSNLNEQGWLETKDKGEWRTDEQDNELVILGRIDNMFISGGENIQPEEIERVLLQAEGVKQVFVLPIEDREFGQRPAAIVEFQPDFDAQHWQSAVDFLKNFLQGRLERFKQPIVYLPLPPNLAQGAIKISRQALKIWLAEQILQLGR